MKRLLIPILCLIFSQYLVQAQNCTQPSIAATSGEGMYCLGDTITLKITGQLNDAQEWQWSTGSCGSEVIADAKKDTLVIAVKKTMSYFVRGVGGCVENAASCTEIKIQLDTIPPEVNCLDDITVQNDEGLCSAEVTYEPPTATDNCPGEVKVELTDGLGSGETFPVGVTTETYLVTDSLGNSTKCSFNVNVKDAESPVISCPADIEVENDPGECGAIVTYEMPSATDNCGVKAVTMMEGLESGSMFPVGTTTQTYVATDEAGNKASCSFNITVLDTEPPVIILKNNLKTKWPPNHKHFEVMIDDYIESVTDNCPGVSIDDVIIDEISSDEALNSNGDGNTEDDIVIGDDCKTVSLMAERQGSGNGRVYMVHIAVVDAHGNIGKETIMSEIPKSNGKNGAAVDDGPVYVVNGCDIELPEDVAEAQSGATVEQNTGEENGDGNRLSTDLNDGGLMTYPNPYENAFSIKFKPADNDQISIELYNPTGIKIMKVFEGNVEKSRLYTWSVQLGNLKDQVLILVIKGKKNYALRKVIKM